LHTPVLVSNIPPAPPGVIARIIVGGPLAKTNT
jgi:hypothetical protein